MKIKRPEIVLIGIQIKSLRIAQRLARAIGVIEENCGIHSTRVSLQDPFVCPDIDIALLDRTPEELLLRDLLQQIKAARNGQ